MTLSRREFLAAGCPLGAAVSFGLGLPAVFQRAALAAPRIDERGAKDTILVVVQLTGGNDGLNTVIPFRDPDYAAARPTLRQTSASVKKINDDLALHPSMTGFAELLERGELAIVQGVGYSNPNRSHFSSMDIWHKASRSKDERFGWLGRTLPKLGGDGSAVNVDRGEAPKALFGAAGHAPSVTSLDDYRIKVTDAGSDPQKCKLIANLAAAKSSGDNELLQLVRQSAQQTYKSSERLATATDRYDPAVEYPATSLAARLKLIAQLIDAGLTERIYYTSHGGFDTHAAQAATHGRLLGDLAGSLNAFQQDLAKHGHQQRVLAMTFSEFGRRVKENGSAGTDHGAASQMFLIGDAVQPGPIGEHPSLTDLSRGDLKFHTDFRSVYATLLENWLGVASEPILGTKYPLIKPFQQPAAKRT